MPVNSTVRVLVVDDHAGVRAGISSLVDGERPCMCSVGAAATPDEALSQVRALQPDVVVLDVNLAGEDGLVLIPAMRRSAPCQIVVLTSLVDPHVAEKAHGLGAHGCVHKTAPAGDLLASILSAHARTTATRAAGDPANAGGALSRANGDETPTVDRREI